jgi:hypothetical protein
MICFYLFIYLESPRKPIKPSDTMTKFIVKTRGKYLKKEKEFLMSCWEKKKKIKVNSYD